MLDQFRTQKLEWNRANNQIYDRVEANSGDSNGRALFVQILNGGMVEDLTGAVLSLAWNKRTEQGLEAFDEVDAKKGQFRLFYPTGMLVNRGVLQASLVLVDVTGRIESKPFDIIIHKGTVDDEAVESDNKFTALTTALVKVSQVQAEFDSLYADKSQMMDTLHDDKKADMEALEQDYANRANTLETAYAPRLTGVEGEIDVARGGATTLGERLDSNEMDLTIEKGRIDNLLSLPPGSTTNDARLEDIKIGADGKTYDSPANAVREQIKPLNKFRDDITNFVTSTNLLNVDDVNFKAGFYIRSTTGAVIENAIYDTTGFIHVTPQKKIFQAIKFNGRSKTPFRFLAAYDKDGNILPEKGSNADFIEYVVPLDVAYVRLSYLNRADYKDRAINLVDANDNSIPAYEKYFTPHYLIDTDATLTKSGKPADAKAVGEALSTFNPNFATPKNPTDIKKESALNANVAIAINDFPEMLKTGQVVTYSAKFDDFSELDVIKIGFINPSYGTYQSWLEITHDSVKWLLSGTNPILNNLHSLVISKYINVTFKISTDTAQLSIVITTATGTYTFNQTSDSTRFNAIGTLTAQATIATSNVVLSGTCTQFKCETWLIGDSYFGNGPSRIGGRLMEWGYSKDVLIDGLGGLNSVQAYAELQKLLKYGTPKTLVWYLGMNDNATTVNTHFPLVEQICDDNKIELIFNRIPFVPSRLTHNAAVNNYVISSGKRYIDSFGSVGADANGNWYAGHLNSDGVHPDPLGAAALTSRLIADVPEILS